MQSHLVHIRIEGYYPCTNTLLAGNKNKTKQKIQISVHVVPKFKNENIYCVYSCLTWEGKGVITC